MSSKIPYRSVKTIDGYQVTKLPPFENDYFPPQFQSEGRIFYYADFEIDGKKIVIYIDQLLDGEGDYIQLKEAWKKQISNWS